MTTNDFLTIAALMTAAGSLIKTHFDKKSQDTNDNMRVAETVEKVYGSMIKEMKAEIAALKEEVRLLKIDREEGNKVLEIIYKFNCGAHCKILKAVKAFKDGKDNF